MRRIQFGFPNDNGLGDRLVDSILRGEKTATCTPLRWYGLEPDDTAEIHEYLAVVDGHGVKRCTIQITEKYEIPFGEIGLRVALAETARTLGEFRDGHRQDYARWAGELNDDSWELTDETLIVVEHFRLVPDQDRDHQEDAT